MPSRRILPEVTCNFCPGLVVPIPTLPVEVMRSLSSLLVPKVNTLEAGECIVVPVPRLNVSAESLSVSAI